VDFRKQPKTFLDEVNVDLSKIVALNVLNVIKTEERVVVIMP